MVHSTAAAVTIECSDQPLDLTFHPSKVTLVAAALVDGTIEVHDFGAQQAADGGSAPAAAAAAKTQQNFCPHDADDDEDEDDTIVSSTAVHTQLLPTREGGAKPASCRAVLFAADGTALWTGGSAGDVVCLDAALVSTFSGTSSKKKTAVRYRIL
jgi:hypothetical protein